MDESTKRIRYPDSMRQALLSALLPTLVLFILAPTVGVAQVVTNITSLPTDTGYLGTTITHTGGHLYDIGGGTRPGDGTGPILFHSFGDFSVGQSEGQSDIANFFNDSGVTTTNIIGRVTGGNPSNIDGIIRTTDFPGANLFLINQFGIVFGPHGSFEVGGSVSFSTSQYLRLFDGINSGNFYADPANDVPVPATNSVFAMAPVVDFGFLSPVAPAAYGFLDAPNPSAAITVQGSALSVLPGQSISLVGGQVIIESGTPDGGTAQPTQLSAPSGKIQLATAASPGEFDVNTLQSFPNTPEDPASAVSFTSFGSVSLAAGSSIDVHGASTVFVIGGQLVLSVNDATLSTSDVSPAPSDTIILSSGSSIVTSTSGTDPGADVQLTAGRLQMDGGQVSTINSGDRDGGNISINATKVGVDGGFVLSSTGQNFTTGEIVGSGNGGNITVQGLPGASDSAADSVTLSNAAFIVTQTSGLGGGGDIHITADSLTIENNGSAIFLLTADGNGVGGNLFLNMGTLSLLDGSLILSSTSNAGGAGGNVTIQGISGESGSAAQRVVLSGVTQPDGSQSSGSQIISGTEGSEGSGHISVRANSLTLDNSSTILSSTGGIGGGGDIVVEVQEASLLEQSTITSRTSAGGAGGTITIQGLDGSGTKAVSLDLDEGSGIISTASNTGRLGDIEVHAMTVSLTNQAVILAGGEADTAATAGDVTIVADSVSISGRSAIANQVFTADAGQVSITATNQLTLDKGLIATSTSGPGRAGDMVLNVGSISLTNGSNISSASLATGAIANPFDGTTEPPGQAGNVTITATGSFTSDASSIATSAEANRGGDISITAQSVQLSNGTLITANSKAPLEVTRLVLDQDGQLVSQVVGDGNAGNITIHSGSTFVMKNSSMTTEATQASGGQIEITAPEMAQLSYSKISTSVAGSAVDTAGGNITIDPQFVVLQNSQIIAQAFAGAGGAINIIATSAFISDPLSIVNASSTLGISGTVNIQSPLQNIGGELTALTEEFSSAAALLAQQCAARAADGKFSTFVIAAREGLPAEPGGFLASPSLTTELLRSRLSGGQASHSQLSAFTGLFPKYDAKPIQLAKLGNACR